MRVHAYMTVLDRYGRVTPRLAALVFMMLIGGFLCGFVGAGGGIFFIYAIGKMMGEGRTRDTFATSSLLLLVASAISVSIYFLGGKISAEASPHYIVAGIAGGFLGAYLLPRVPTRLLKIVFALIVIYSGTRMVLSA